MVKTMHKQQGFTLIELMIVVAIIGILAAIAIPAYQDYVKRSKVTELVTAGSACKTSVAEYWQTNGNLPTNLEESGCRSATSQYVSSIGVSNGIISVTSQNIPDANGDYVLTPDVSGDTIEWSCTNSTISDTYLPANCRGS
ncbi:pilin [Spectribacter hydrogenooxidans]|uniref:Pilin n=1 Tax=Spectribacter hydrogenoxidans TaxID=3075608 RepID=A0ABU3BYU1_9GAMM|nr:pilin [Salinisphaera sp. W335]MDT0634279.1 pilin [Salinisphaera sp. W335]